MEASDGGPRLRRLRLRRERGRRGEGVRGRRWRRMRRAVGRDRHRRLLPALALALHLRERRRARQARGAGVRRPVRQRRRPDRVGRAAPATSPLPADRMEATRATASDAEGGDATPAHEPGTAGGPDVASGRPSPRARADEEADARTMASRPADGRSARGVRRRRRRRESADPDHLRRRRGGLARRQHRDRASRWSSGAVGWMLVDRPVIALGDGLVPPARTSSTSSRCSWAADRAP